MKTENFPLWDFCNGLNATELLSIYLLIIYLFILITLNSCV